LERYILKGQRIGFSVKYKQITKKNEPEKNVFSGSLFFVFAYTSIKKIKKILPLQNGFIRQCERRLFPYPFSDKFNWNKSNRRRKTKKEV